MSYVFSGQLKIKLSVFFPYVLAWSSLLVYLKCLSLSPLKGFKKCDRGIKKIYVVCGTCSLLRRRVVSATSADRAVMSLVTHCAEHHVFLFWGCVPMRKVNSDLHLQTTVQFKQVYSSGKLKYLIESPNKYATATAITKNDNVANISKENLRSTAKILNHCVKASNLMTLSVM